MLEIKDVTAIFNASCDPDDEDICNPVDNYDSCGPDIGSGNCGPDYGDCLPD